MTDATIEIPADATPDTTFRCAKWACTLAFKHCLRRQSEARKPHAAAKDQTPIPVHPFCANECAIGRVITARFGKAEVPLLQVNGLGAMTRYAPLPPATPAEETTMPCGNCGSKDHNRRTCSKPSASAAVKAAPKLPPPPKPSRPARGARIELRVETVDDLLGRRDELLAELDQVDGRIARALAAKEDELAKLRAAVKAASQRAAAAAEKAA